MSNEMNDPIENGLSGFFKEFGSKVTSQKKDEFLEILREEKISHIEDRLFDQVIVYMGDKETERTGSAEEILEIAVLAYLIWLRKKT